MSARRYRNVPLAIGTLLGAAIAALGLLRAPPESERFEDAVAVVNGRSIRRADYEAAIAALSAERRDGTLDPALRKHVLDRLVEEELLIQAALSLGLAERDRRVRADLSSAAIGFIVDAPSEAEPTEETLRSFFEDNRASFATHAQVQVEQVYLAMGSVAEQDRALREAESVRERWIRGERVGSDPPPLPLPSTPLPMPKLAEYVGSSAAERISSLPPGGVSEPLMSDGGYKLFRVVAKTGGDIPRFEEVRPLVLAQFERQAGEARLRRFLREERARATVSIAPDLLP